MSSDNQSLTEYGATDRRVRCHACGVRVGKKWNRSPQGRRYCPDCHVISKNDQGAFDDW